MKYARNLEYKVVITEFAEYQLEQILIYILFQFKNPDAVRSVRRDVEVTKNKLTFLPHRIKLCDEPEFAIREYRVVLLEKHDYLMLYRIDGNIVYIDGIYHQLQNYQNLFK